MSDFWKTTKEVATYAGATWGAVQGVSVATSAVAPVAGACLAIPLIGPLACGAVLGLSALGGAVCGGILGGTIPGAALPAAELLGRDT